MRKGGKEKKHEEDKNRTAVDMKLHKNTTGGNTILRRA